jgi:hypothetical protein
VRRTVLLLWMSTASSAVAQATDSSAMSQRLCFAPRNLPRCQKYLIFELGGARPVVTSQIRQTTPSGSFPRPDFDPLFRFNFGMSKNIGGHSSLGVATGWDIGRSGRSVELRYRRWSPRSNAGMEWMAGAESRDVPSANSCTANGWTCGLQTKGTGPTIGTTFVLGPWVQLNSRASFLHAEGEWRNVVMAGVSGTSNGALTAGAAGAVAFGVLLLLFFTNGPST